MSLLEVVAALAVLSAVMVLGALLWATRSLVTRGREPEDL